MMIVAGKGARARPDGRKSSINRLKAGPARRELWWAEGSARMVQAMLGLGGCDGVQPLIYKRMVQNGNVLAGE